MLKLMIKKLGQHRFLHFTNYMSIPNIQVEGALSLLILYKHITSGVLYFLVNISSPEAYTKIYIGQHQIDEIIIQVEPSGSMT